MKFSVESVLVIVVIYLTKIEKHNPRKGKHDTTKHTKPT